MEWDFRAAPWSSQIPDGDSFRKTTLCAWFKSIASNDAEDLYYKLRWSRFGHAVLLVGVVQERNANSGLFRLAANGREDWCRLKDGKLTNLLLEEGKMIEVFGWEKWVSHILEILEVNDLTIQGHHP
jgi:hypothetical protein